MYDFYSECIAISQDAVSFNVKIYCMSKKIGKANVLITRNLQCSSICLDLSDFSFNENNLKVAIIKHCEDRCRSILAKEEKES